MPLALLLLLQLSNPTPAPAAPAATATTDAEGQWTATWDQRLATAPRRVVVTPRSPDIFTCTATSWTETTVSGRCWAAQSTTLPALIGSVPGTVVSPFRNAAAGLSLSIIGSM